MFWKALNLQPPPSSVAFGGTALEEHLGESGLQRHQLIGIAFQRMDQQPNSEEMTFGAFWPKNTQKRSQAKKRREEKIHN